MKRYETVGERIRALRKSKGLTQVELAKIADVTSPNVTAWEKDAYLPKTKPTEAMASYFNVSTSYILDGVDDDLTSSNTQTLDNNVVPVAPKLLPVLSWVQAGTMTAVESIDLSKINEWLPPLSVDDPNECFYLKVVGISNEPDYIAGDYILVDPTIDISDLVSGDLIVVRDNTDATFKKFIIESDERKYLQALNPNFKPNIIEFEESMELVGLVIDAFRPLGGSRSKRVRKS